MRIIGAIFCLFTHSLASTQLLGAADEQATIDLYQQQVKSVLASRCFACHGALKQEANLRLDTVDLMLKGGDSGPAIVRENSASSLILQRVSAIDESLRMPHEGEPLKQEQIDAIARWIDQQALGPLDESPEDDPREHWAFQRILRPLVPQAAGSDWSKNAIDHFIERSLRDNDLTPQVNTHELLLVRRLYVDLLGLMPSREELALIDFATKDWYERLVDRLLDDPRHGERWARHWMDIWRYSDWWGLGEQLRNSQNHMWHWRDWIIQSLNQDLPLDEMIRQMLAADELYPGDIEKIRATGYLARNYFLFNRNPWMEETVEHVSKSLMGITMNCSKCHDHKFDPIDQTDFYRMRAFFEPYHVRLDMVPGEVDLGKDGIPRVFDGWLDASTYLYHRGNENQPDKSKTIMPGVPGVLNFEQLTIELVELPQMAWQPETQPWIIENYRKSAEAKMITARSTATSIKKRLEDARALVKKNSGDTAGDSDAVSDKALADAEAEMLEAQASLTVAESELASVEARARFFSMKDTSQTAPFDSTDKTAGSPMTASETLRDEARKLAIAAERQVAANRADQTIAHVKLKLLRCKPEQRGAIESELDKARQALEQTKKLLDEQIKSDAQPESFLGAKWTATRFLNSTADDPTVKFPPTSTGRRTALAKWLTDPRHPLTARVAVNHLWNRHFGTPLVATVFDFGRKGARPTHPELLDWLASELIESGWSMKHLHRLIVTSATYRLSSSNAGGEENLARDPDNHFWWRRNSVRVESQVVRDSILHLAGELDPALFGPSVPAASQAQSKRRSVYFVHSNNDRNSFLSIFDEAAVKECYRRDESIVPQQALALVNSGFVLNSAGKIAAKLHDSVQSEDQFIAAAFRLALGAEPTESERVHSARAIQAWSRIEGMTVEQARKLFVWTLINHNDFVTLR